jgi:Zn-dependent protease with chaperone function
MFYALALVLCLAVLFIVAAGASIFCAAGLYAGKRWLYFLPTRSRANLLFMLRAMPFFLAGLVTLGLALPAFLRFEPRASHEIMGPRLLALAVLGAFVLGAIAVRTLRIIRATHRAQKQWRIHSRRLQIESVRVPVYCAGMPCPLFAVTGMFRPKIFVAQAVIEKLSPGELDAALAHELAHVSALDNLKQLILKATTLPRWLRLFANSDAIWLNNSEMAADECALASGVSAMDLSSALVKVGGLIRQVPAGNLIAASHLLPITAQSGLETRVNHLRKLLESEDQVLGTRPKRRKYWPVFSFFLLVACYAICLNSALPWMHEILERLVR